MKLIIDSVNKNTNSSRLAYNISLVLLTSLYVMYLHKVGLWYLDSYKDLFFFIISLSLFLVHIVIFVSCEGVVRRFELTRLFIKYRDCEFSNNLKEDIRMTDLFLKTLLYIDIVILILYVVG